MDPYEQMLANGATPEQIEALLRTMLPRTRERISVGGAITNDVPPGQNRRMLPLTLNDRANLFTQMGLDTYAAEPDVTGLQQYARQRSEEGNRDMLRALAAQLAGERFAPVQAQFLKRAMAAQEPLKVGNAGYITPSGEYVKDTTYAQERRAEKYLGLGAQYMRADEQEKARIANEQLRRELAQNAADLRREIAGQGRYQHFQNPETGEIVLYNTKTAEVMPLPGVQGSPPAPPPSGAPGFKLPASGGPKLTETQDKSRFYADNMARSLPSMLEVYKSGYEPTRIDQIAAGPTATGFIGSMADAVIPRSMASEKGRQFYDAGRQVLAAILRKESGAAITQDEWTSYGPIYLPWPGDSQKDRQRKMQDLKSMANSMAISAGPAQRFWVPFDMQVDQIGNDDDGIIDLTP